MISLSHEIEALHTLLEHFYDSQRNVNAAQLADFVGRQPVAARSVLPAPAVPAAGWRRRIGCTPRREGSGRAPGELSCQGPHARRAGSRIPGAVLEAAATGLCSCGIGRRRSNRLPVDWSHDIVAEGSPRRIVTPRQIGAQPGVHWSTVLPPGSSWVLGRRRQPRARPRTGLSTVLHAADHADLPHPALNLGRPVSNEAVLAVERLGTRVRIGHPQCR